MLRFRCAVLLLAAGLFVPACAPEDASPNVMTLNLYYGFDVGPLLASENPEEIPVLAAQALAQHAQTDFPARAAAIADRVAALQPHLIGLQEVALLRIQSPGDAVEGGTTPAETVYADHLAILLAALAARGLDYRVAGQVLNVDVELPVLASVDPLAFDDIRLTDSDVILARGDVPTSNVAAKNYAATLPLANLGIEVPRGYVALDASMGGVSYRFVTTHLEDLPFEPIQLAQADELVEALKDAPHPVILTGDFNSPAPSGAACDLLASEGYVDVWPRNVRKDEGEGLTWGHEPSLANAGDAFTMRIDLVLVRTGPKLRLKSVSAEVWGDEAEERTESGLWPSDHAAVNAILELRRR
jgi:endonuclease/exonuclease/phosphatase family metal-dependent hydrolase